MNERGMTLLEVLVASVIMAVAVVGLFSSLSTSMRNASKVTDYDRAAMLARAKMDEILAQTVVPRRMVFEGEFDPAVAGGMRSGWRARVTPFEFPRGATAGTPSLDRLELEVWWRSGDNERKLAIEAFRKTVLMPEDVPGAMP